MNDVAPSRRLNAPSAWLSSGESWSATAEPREVPAVERGRSVGSSKAGSSALNCLFQYESCLSNAAPLSVSRSHSVKSEYWTGSSGREDGRPAQKDSYSAV